MVGGVDAENIDAVDDQDWRLRAQLDVEDTARSLGGVLARLRPSADDGGEEVARELEHSAPSDVVITHDGRMLFAYANTRERLQAAHAALEQVLEREGIHATILISRWEQELDDWVQVDPPLDAEARAALAGREREAASVETRTLVAHSGRMIRGEFEQTMRNWAAKLDLSCEVLEHPHLLSSQVAFTVTGPKGLVDEFERGLHAEELATIRTEAEVMASPL